MHSEGLPPPLHVTLSEPCIDPHDRPGEPGRSVRLKGQLYDFGSLIPLYGSGFTSRLLDAFTRAYVLSTPSTTERRALQLKRFLKAVATLAVEPDIEDCAVVRFHSALAEGRHGAITREDMVDAVEAFASRVRDIRDRSIVSTDNKLTRQRILEGLSSVLRGLAQNGFWPDIGSVRGLRDPLKHCNNIPALGELTREGERQDVEGEPADSYLAMTERSRNRLLALREHLESALLEEKQAFDRREVLIQRSDLPSLADLRRAVDELTDFGNPRRVSPYPTLVQACFPLDDDEKRLASLLKYLDAVYLGIFKFHDLPYGLRRVVRTCGGTAAVMRHFEGGGRALAAAYGIVSIDTGLNVQPLDDIAGEPFVGTMHQGKMKLRLISATKNRANFETVDGFIEEQIEADVLEEQIKVPRVLRGTRISAVQAIEIWRKLSEPMRVRALKAKSGHAKYLWIIRRGDSPTDVRRYSHVTFIAWWTGLLAEVREDPVIGGLPIQRRMIRTTIIQLRQVDHDGDARLVALLSNHGSARTTNAHYLNRRHIRRMLDEKIREFQKYFEAAVAGDQPQRAEQLGLSSQEFSRRRKHAVDTGLGFLCADPEAGVQPGTKGSTCSKLECCPDCPLMRFVPREESLEALALFRRSLEAAQDEFIARNVGRWVRVWLPALALCLAIYEILMSGSKKRMLERADRAAAEGLAAGRLVLLRIW
jgi:hypothetical protein